MFNWLLKADKKQKAKKCKEPPFTCKDCGFTCNECEAAPLCYACYSGRDTFVQIVRVKFQSNSIKDTVLYPLHLSVLVLDTF